MLLPLLASSSPVTLDQLQHALGQPSRRTTFRYLRQVRHLRSYNHNGRFYTGRDPARFDRFGLLSLGTVHFSRDGSLAAVRQGRARRAAPARPLPAHPAGPSAGRVRPLRTRRERRKRGLYSLLTLLLEQAREAGWTGARIARSTRADGAPPSVDFVAEARHCPHCGRALDTHKSKTRVLLTLAAGTLRARYRRHLQREEIRADLARQGIALSAGSVSALCDRFLAALEALHWQRGPARRACSAITGMRNYAGGTGRGPTTPDSARP